MGAVISLRKPRRTLIEALDSCLGACLPLASNDGDTSNPALIVHVGNVSSSPGITSILSSF